MKMKKGFNPTPKQKKDIKNVYQELGRATRRFKNLMKNPVIVAASLDRSTPKPVE